MIKLMLLGVPYIDHVERKSELHPSLIEKGYIPEFDQKKDEEVPKGIQSTFQTRPLWITPHEEVLIEAMHHNKFSLILLQEKYAENTGIELAMLAIETKCTKNIILTFDDFKEEYFDGIRTLTHFNNVFPYSWNEPGYGVVRLAIKIPRGVFKRLPQDLKYKENYFVEYTKGRGTYFGNLLSIFG